MFEFYVPFKYDSDKLVIKNVDNVNFINRFPLFMFVLPSHTYCVVSCLYMQSSCKSNRINKSHSNVKHTLNYHDYNSRPKIRESVRALVRKHKKKTMSHIFARMFARVNNVNNLLLFRQSGTHSTACVLCVNKCVSCVWSKKGLHMRTQSDLADACL